MPGNHDSDGNWSSGGRYDSGGHDRSFESALQGTYGMTEDEKEQRREDMKAETREKWAHRAEVAGAAALIYAGAGKEGRRKIRKGLLFAILGIVVLGAIAFAILSHVGNRAQEQRELDNQAQAQAQQSENQANTEFAQAHGLPAPFVGCAWETKHAVHELPLHENDSLDAAVIATVPAEAEAWVELCPNQQQSWVRVSYQDLIGWASTSE